MSLDTADTFTKLQDRAHKLRWENPAFVAALDKYMHQGPILPKWEAEQAASKPVRKPSKPPSKPQ